MESKNARNNFNKLTASYVNGLLTKTLQFKDKKLESAYNETLINWMRINFTILAIIAIINSTVLLAFNISRGNTYFPEYLLIIKYVAILLFVIVLLIIGLKVKRYNQLFTIQILLLVTIFISNVTNIAYCIAKNLDHVYYVKYLFYLVTNIAFFSAIFLPFSIIKSVLINLILAGIIAISYIYSRIEDQVIEITFLVVSLVYYEVFNYNKERLAKLSFIEKLRSDTLIDYFIDLISQMNIGVGVVNETSLVFTNEIFTKYYNNIFHRDIENGENNIKNQELNDVLKGINFFKGQFKSCKLHFLI